MRVVVQSLTCTALLALHHQVVLLDLTRLHSFLLLLRHGGHAHKEVLVDYPAWLGNVAETLDKVVEVAGSFAPTFALESSAVHRTFGTDQKYLEVKGELLAPVE